MKLILSALIFANLSIALADCQDFARVAPTQSDQSNLADANICSKELTKALKASALALDKSTSNCESALADLKSSISTARDFQDSARQALAWQGPSEKIKRRFQKGILDLTYALTDDLNGKSCDENEFIEVKAQAQTEIIALERTKYSLP